MFLDGDALPLSFPPLLGWLLINPYRTSIVRLGTGSGGLVKRIYQSQCGPARAAVTRRGADLAAAASAARLRRT